MRELALLDGESASEVVEKVEVASNKREVTNELLKTAVVKELMKQ